MQISFFDGKNDFKIYKPIRLIELFGGYGSQAFALKHIGISFEHWKLCEWAVKSIQAYKDAHFKGDNTDYSKELTDNEIFNKLFELGISANYNEPMTYEQVKRLGIDKARQIYNNIKATHNLVNIQQVKGEDLEITDVDKYCYVMTYSFPCQDLSSAGLGKGMEKDSGTRSGLLWEVERILDELKNEGKNLPQVLLMENVPEVIGSNNVKHFAEWLAKLESLGYHCYWKVLNSKEYGIPQSRERCFMVSILGDYYYSFPQTIPLTLKLADILEENVDEKYYLSKKMVDFFVENSKRNEEKGNGFRFKPIEKEQAEISKTITTRSGSRMDDNFITEPIACELRCDEGIRTFEDNVMGTLRTIDACGQKHIIEPQNMKEQLCNQLIEENKVSEGDIIRHSYSGSRLDSFHIENKENHDCCATLTTRADCLGIVVNDLTTKNKRLAQMVNDNKIEIDKVQAIDIYNQNVHEEMQTIKTNIDKANMTAITQNLRIRKLTPKECFRLMGVKDKDFEKIAQNQSNASLYHLAGDSIVIQVLVAIFGQMLENFDFNKYIQEFYKDIKGE